MAASKQQQTVLILLCALISGCGQADLSTYEALYAERWGAPNLTGWTVTIVDTPPVVGGQARAGVTNWDTKTVLLWRQTLKNAPHELHHVALGPSSYDHHGWCAEGFGQWEVTALGFDERAYLGCP